MLSKYQCYGHDFWYGTHFVEQVGGLVSKQASTSSSDFNSSLNTA